LYKRKKRKSLDGIVDELFPNIRKLNLKLKVATLDDQKKYTLK